MKIHQVGVQQDGKTVQSTKYKKPKITFTKCYPTFCAKNVYKWVMRKTEYGARCNWISVRQGHFLSVLFSGLQLVQFQIMTLHTLSVIDYVSASISNTLIN